MIGKSIGSYEVVAKLGEGGMGAVYRARDTKLNRDVALKLLPDAVADDPDRLSRFRREAQLLAALNHPNIAQVYGLEDAPSAPPALVMELVPGRTLADVMRTGPLAWDDVLPIARQLAAALENAHEHGIIHRDLKPANIKLRDDGTVKVLDFGLAKLVDDSSPADNAATMTSPAITQAGIILGTAAYMSPEQARGRTVDKRADIWAYGVVLFELLTGQTMFAGASVTETIAAVIKDDPKLDRLPASTPPAARALIARCLERDPARRLRDIGEARILLAGPLEAAASVIADRVSSPPRRSTWLLAGAGAVALAAVASFAAWTLKPLAERPVRRLELALPGGVVDSALSHDGSRLAYIADSHLYIRQFDRIDTKDLGPLHVTARQPIWSPDDRTIAFVSEASIRTIPADGGPVFVVAPVPASGRVMGLVWRGDGRLMFSVWRDSLYAVLATGGTATVVLAVDPATEIDFHHLTALPDGRLVVATHKRAADADVIELVELSGAPRRVQLTDDRNASGFEYVEPGTLLFRRGTTNTGIWSVPFREGAIDVNQATLVQAGATDFRVARDGTLVAQIPAVERWAFVWVDLQGAETRVPGADLEDVVPVLEISPDGRRVVFVRGSRRVLDSGGGSLNNATVVVRDLITGTDTPLMAASTPGSQWEDTSWPTWTPDGQRIIHRHGAIERMNLVERRADVASTGRVLIPGLMGRLMPDGRSLLYLREDRSAGTAEIAPVAADGAVGVGAAFFPSGQTVNVRDLDVSSDGLLVAYSALQAGLRGDAFVAAIAKPAEQVLVQQGGGRPRFTKDGKQLFLLRGTTDAKGQPQGQLLRASITSTPRISLGPPEVVLRDAPGGARLGSYDVAPDGKALLMFKPLPPPPGQGLRFVLVENAVGHR